MRKTLVAVAAHADDVEMHAGGTAAKWADQGGSVHILMATNNCSGYIVPESGDESAKFRLPPGETTAIRHREQQAAAALIEAEVHYLNYSQRHYWDGEREVNIAYEHDAPADPAVAGIPTLLIAYQQPGHYRRLADLIAGIKPDLVLTHGVFDLDPEHHAVACMVWQAFRKRERDLTGVPLRFWTPGSSCAAGIVDAHYDYFENIGDYYERKLDLFRCHASQVTEMRLRMIQERAGHYGALAGVRYAEPFMTANRSHGIA